MSNATARVEEVPWVYTVLPRTKLYLLTILLVYNIQHYSRQFVYGGLHAKLESSILSVGNSEELCPFCWEKKYENK